MKRGEPLLLSKTPASAQPSRGLRILVVEDHPDTRRGLEVLLGILGHRADFAGGVRAAIQLATSGTEYDLLLSDIGLPDGNGWDLLRHLEETGHRPPQAVAISGFSCYTDVEKSLAAGFRQHLIKPFAPEELDSVLQTVAAERTVPAEVLPA